MGLKEIKCEGKEQWRAVFNTALNRRESVINQTIVGLSNEDSVPCSELIIFYVMPVRMLQNSL